MRVTASFIYSRKSRAAQSNNAKMPDTNTLFSLFLKHVCRPFFIQFFKYKDRGIVFDLERSPFSVMSSSLEDDITHFMVYLGRNTYG